MDAADPELVEIAARIVQSAKSKGREVAADKTAFDEHMSRTEDAAIYIHQFPQMSAMARRVPGGLTAAEGKMANTARYAAMQALFANIDNPCSVAAIGASSVFMQSMVAFAEVLQAHLQARERVGPGQSSTSDASGLGDGIASHLTCVICSELLCYPLSLPCGHSSSCGVCLLEWNVKGGNGCPACRAAFPPTPPAPSVQLQYIVEALHATHDPSSEAFVAWEKRKSAWAAMQPRVQELWRAPPIGAEASAEASGVDGGGNEWDVNAPPSRARPRPHIAGDAVVALDAGAAGRQARYEARMAQHELREREEAERRHEQEADVRDESDAVVPIQQANPPPAAAPTIDVRPAIAPSPPPPSAEQNALANNEALAPAFDRVEGFRRTKAAIATSGMPADRTGTLDALRLPRAVQVAVQASAVATNGIFHVTTTPERGTCVSEYGMDNRNLGQLIGRLDVAAITAARIAGHFVHPYFADHGRKFVLWYAPPTLDRCAAMQSL